jgi:subtilisin family serine protease
MIRPAQWLTSPNRLVLPVIALGLLSACADQTTAPTRMIGPSSRSSDVVAAPARGTYLVLAQGARFSRDFAEKVAALGGKVRSIHDGTGFAVVTDLTPSAASALSAVSGVAEVDADGVVSLAEPAATTRADASAVARHHAQNDIDPAAAALFSWQWNMVDISAPRAWQAGRVGSKRVTVAIIDTGIDYDNPDLDGLVDLSRSVSLSASDDSITTHYFAGRNPISDYNGHGTNVASQVSSNAVVFAGVTAKTTLMGVKVLGVDGTGSTGDVLNGILWAADHGADVANLSLGGAFARKGNRRLIHVITRVLDYARRKGVVMVVAAGNDGTDLDHNGDEFDAYCDLQHVICVSAVGPLTPTGPLDVPAFYTNFGRAIDVAGPGGNADAAHNFPAFDWPWSPPADIASWVWSFCSKTEIDAVLEDGTPFTPCESGNFLRGLIGTSQATPHVSGLAALLVDRYGKNNPGLIRVLIEASADDLGKRGKDPFFGRGRINVARALGLRPIAH